MDDNNDIVEETADVEEKTNPSENDAIVLMNLVSLIKSHITNIENLQAEARKHKEMLDNVFLNDATFREHSDRAKEANLQKSATRTQIMKQPSVVSVANKAKAVKAEIKELQVELSEYLQEYQRLSGSTSIEDDKGEVRQIVNESKLIKTSAPKR